VTDIFIKLLNNTIIHVEAPCGADYVLDVLVKDGYDAKMVSGMVVVKEKENTDV
jgi:hypothetical protein